jgi:hypothetical protein
MHQSWQAAQLDVALDRLAGACLPQLAPAASAVLYN